MFFVSSDNQFGSKRGLSSSHAIYTVKTVVNECRGILSGSPDGRGFGFMIIFEF